ncbi:MAG: DUF4783 domain-containing protein [Alistipes sp.]|nr:DUF4783 domain-containing protein [Candidatus Minthomonas equi]
MDYLQMMRNILSIISFSILFSVSSYAQNSDDASDVFSPISKYISRGDAQCLSVWFSENLEIDMMGRPNNYSRSQASRVMESFFEEYPPRYFQIVHKSGSYPMNCAVGDMEGGGYKFLVTILVKTSDGGNAIQQIKIERE